MNSLIIFIEQRYYTKETLLNSIDKLFLDELFSKGIIESKNGFIKFKFVGIISVRNEIISIIPKIFTTHSQEALKETLKIFQTYTGSKTQLYDGLDYFNFELDHPDCNEISIAEFLIKDFQENGLINFERHKYDMNENGEINWPLTVQEIDPIFSSNSPIYADTYNEITTDDKSNITVLIHKWSLQYVLKKYSLVLGVDSFHLNYNVNLTDLGSKHFLVQHLQNQLNEIYFDREIQLIKSLIFLIKKKAGPIKNDLSLYGTKKFENIWEAICKYVCNDNYKSGKYFPNPEWQIFDNKYSTKSVLIPDITCEDPITGNFFLFDAKYYNLNFNGSISGEPDYKDILKQFQYQHHIEEKLKKEITNSFLFPIDDVNFKKFATNENKLFSNETQVVIGYVKYEISPYSKKKILIILCPFLKWSNIYNNEKPLSFKSLFWDP